MTFEVLHNVETPLPVFKTYIGNLLYSTLDLTRELKGAAPALFGQVDIQDIFSRDFGEISIGDIQVKHNMSSEVEGGLRVNILSSRQKGQLGSNPSGLSVDTAAGRKVVTVADYSKRIVADAFPAVIALADEIPLFSGLKSSTKACARSLLWLQQLKANSIINWEKTYLFGVSCAFSNNQHSTVPCTNSTGIDQRVADNAKELLNLGCNGLVVGGAGMGESLYQLGVAIRSVKCAATVSESAETEATTRVLVMVQEMDTVSEILLATESGGDLIGTNLPQILSTAGLVLTWDLKWRSSGNNSSSNRDSICDGEKRKSSDIIPENEVGAANECENPTKKQNTSTVAATSLAAPIDALLSADCSSASASAGQENTGSSSHPTPDDFKHAHSTGGVINLWDTTHRKTLKPILEDCKCHACMHHTRAYIHHLLLAKEMLGDILVYCHNQHQTVQLFNEIRKVRKENEVDVGSEILMTWSAALIAVMH